MASLAQGVHGVFRAGLEERPRSPAAALPSLQGTRSVSSAARIRPGRRGKIMKARSWIAVLAFAAAALPNVFAAEDGFVIKKPEDIVFSPNPNGEGPEFATIYGDPTKEGFYIIRARFKPGVMSRPHRHPHERFVTVIKGTWWAGTGSVFDPSKTTPLPAGSYMLHPAGAAHYDGAKDEEVIVEIKGMGPAPSIPVKP
jgi:quercetin dioxygenase-like cupin family protein